MICLMTYRRRGGCVAFGRILTDRPIATVMDAERASQHYGGFCRTPEKVYSRG